MFVKNVCLFGCKITGSVFFVYHNIPLKIASDNLKTCGIEDFYYITEMKEFIIWIIWQISLIWVKSMKLGQSDRLGMKNIFRYGAT